MQLQTHDHLVSPVKFSVPPGPSNTRSCFSKRLIILSSVDGMDTPDYQHLHYDSPSGACWVFIYQIPEVFPVTQYMGQSTVPRHGICFFQNPKRAINLSVSFFVVGDARCNNFSFTLESNSAKLLTTGSLKTSLKCQDSESLQDLSRFLGSTCVL